MSKNNAMIKFSLKFQGGFGVALTLGSRDEGIIPVNKNLW